MWTWIQTGLTIILLALTIYSAWKSKKRKELFDERQGIVNCITGYLREQLAEYRLCYSTWVENGRLTSYSVTVYEKAHKDSARYSLARITIQFEHESFNKYMITYHYFSDKDLTDARRRLIYTTEKLDKDIVDTIVETCVEIRRSENLRNFKGVGVIV